jgi:hypothetical protein
MISLKGKFFVTLGASEKGDRNPFPEGTPFHAYGSIRGSPKIIDAFS